MKTLVKKKTFPRIDVKIKESKKNDISHKILLCFIRRIYIRLDSYGQL